MAGTAAAHLVQFYSDTEGLAENLSSIYAEPLMRGETVVVVAAENHRQALDSALDASGVNLSAEYRSRRYLPVDAEEALAAFMTPDGPDARLFQSTIGSTVLDARWRTGSVHAYGEMVGILAARGDLVAALELEALWNRLLAEHPLRLLCGYPRELVGDANPVVDRIIGTHDAMIVTREPTDLTLSATVDLPLGPEAAATARRAADQLLSAWGLPDAGGEGAPAVVVRELVSVAQHAGSACVTLRLGLDGGHVVVSVTEVAGSVADPAPSSDVTEAGRLFAVLSTLAQSWGVQTLPEGRRLWARLRTPMGSPSIGSG
jgi:MEDS: MEthanogen/methylotroph, DcmR Sensory domain